MRSSCISYPAREPLIIIRKSQLAICQGHKAAAALLSFFAYWHDIKLEQSRKAQSQNNIAEKHGYDRSQDESLYQFHTNQQLVEGVLGIGKADSITKGLNILIEAGFVSVHRNPNPRFRFDNTKHFLLHPDKVNEAISALQENPSSIYPKTRSRAPENTQNSSGKTPDDIPINPTTIPEITSKITTEHTQKGVVCDEPEKLASSVEPEFDNPHANSTAEKIKNIDHLTGFAHLCEQEQINVPKWVDFKLLDRWYRTICRDNSPLTPEQVEVAIESLIKQVEYNRWDQADVINYSVMSKKKLFYPRNKRGEPERNPTPSRHWEAVHGQSQVSVINPRNPEDEIKHAKETIQGELAHWHRLRKQAKDPKLSQKLDQLIATEQQKLNELLKNPNSYHL